MSAPFQSWLALATSGVAVLMYTRYFNRERSRATIRSSQNQSRQPVSATSLTANNLDVPENPMYVRGQQPPTRLTNPNTLRRIAALNESAAVDKAKEIKARGAGKFLPQSLPSIGNRQMMMPSSTGYVNGVYVGRRGRVLYSAKL